MVSCTVVQCTLQGPCRRWLLPRLPTKSSHNSKPLYRWRLNYILMHAFMSIHAQNCDCWRGVVWIVWPQGWLMSFNNFEDGMWICTKKTLAKSNDDTLVSLVHKQNYTIISTLMCMYQFFTSSAALVLMKKVMKTGKTFKLFMNLLWCDGKMPHEGMTPKK